MLKTGICDVRDLSEARSLWGRPRRISLNLLGAPLSYGRQADDLFMAVMAPFRVSSGTYRTTARDRFSNFDPIVNRILIDVFGPVPELSIHDWATSDASAALEWARSLQTVAPRIRFCASDRLLTAVKAWRSDREFYFFEPNGQPIEYTRAPFVVSLREPESAAYPVNRCVAAWARRRVRELSAIVPALSWPSVLDTTVLQRKSWRFSQVPLVHPAVLAFAGQNSWFRIAIHSVFEPLSEKADVIRSMNILNRSYFCESELRVAIRACRDSLRCGGVWIVGRSAEAGSADASVFRREDGGFSVVGSTGKGSEIHDLVLAANE